MNPHSFLVPVSLLIGLASMVVYATPELTQPHESILAAAQAHLQETITHQTGETRLELSPLDHRLRLARCSEPLTTFSPPGASMKGKTTVGVRCDKPKPWTLYVSAHIAIQGPVVVALRDLSRGSPIGSEDVALVEKDISRLLRGHFDSPTHVVGRTLKRSLHRDQVVTPSLLLVQNTIKRGQQITILAGNGGIEVRMKGKALRNGNPDDLIPVENLTSRKKIEARVVSAGTVRVD